MIRQVLFKMTAAARGGLNPGLRFGGSLQPGAGRLGRALGSLWEEAGEGTRLDSKGKGGGRTINCLSLILCYKWARRPRLKKRFRGANESVVQRSHGLYACTFEKVPNAVLSDEEGTDRTGSYSYRDSENLFPDLPLSKLIPLKHCPQMMLLTLSHWSELLLGQGANSHE